MTGKNTGSRKVFYGYWILIVAFLCLFISLGLGTYSFSLFVKSLEVDFGWSRSMTMAGITIFWLSMAIASPIVGRFVDTKGPKVAITAGAITAGLGYLILSAMQSIAFYYIGHIIVGLGMAFMGQVPAAAMITNWFHKKRGLATGIMLAGVGVGGAVIVPIIGGYLIPELGWRTGYLIMAVFVWLIMIPITLIIVRTKPSDMGLFPDGESALYYEEKQKSTVSTFNFSIKAVLVTAAFWFIWASYLLNGLSQSGFMHSQVLFLQEIGFSALNAAAILGVISIGSAAGKLGFGWICDYIHPRYAVTISIICQIAGILLTTLTVDSTTPAMLTWIYAWLFGFGMGGLLPTMAMIISTYFGLKSYGTLFGTVSFGFSLGAGLGPLIAGIIHDKTNDYYLPFLFFTVLLAAAIIAVYVFRAPGNNKR